MSPKPTSDAEKRILIRSYGRRKSKGLRPRRSNALESVMAQAAITLPPGDGAVDLASLFAAKPKAIWFEVGFGNGEHMAGQALEHPDTGLIGCEPFINGVAACCVHIEQKNLSNIRIWPDDARMLMARLPDGCLERFYLLHPDPWPKSRHHKRRFIQQETLDEIARLLKPGAELRMATDHADLAEWLQEKAGAHASFVQQPINPAEWPETRYGNKGLQEGRARKYFVFRRK